MINKVITVFYVLAVFLIGTIVSENHDYWWLLLIIPIWWYLQRKIRVARSPKLIDVNSTVYEMALLLMWDEENPTFNSELMDADDFDFSLESLKCLDSYLSIVREKQIKEKDKLRIILRAGAYAGEVLRRRSRATYYWLSYEEALKHGKNPSRWGDSIGASYVLFRRPHSFAYPMGKVSKFLENGSEDSLYYFVKVLLGKDGL